MLNYKFEVKEQDTWIRLKSWVRPFTDGITFDESLDSGSFQLSLIERAEPLRPFSQLRITIYQDEVLKDVLNWQVFNDQVTLRRMGALKLYDHNIQIIELTKTLERDICDSMTVTNYLGHDYSVGFDVVVAEKSGTAASYIEQIKDIYSPYKTGFKFHIDVFQDVLFNHIDHPPGDILHRLTWGDVKTTVMLPDRETEITIGTNTDGEILLDKSGTYTIIYDGFLYQGAITDNVRVRFIVKFNIGVFSDIPAYTDWTITDVVERLLSAGITRRSGIDVQKYIFDKNQAEQFKTIKAPEFFFTRSTLFEALMTVGGYIHAIPRLVDENLPSEQLTVRFDMLGGNDVYEKQLPPMMYEDVIINAEEYCGGLDSPVQNLLNTIDRIAGAVTDPDDGDYKTLRTEQGQIEISENTGNIITDIPINQITEVKCSVPIGGNTQVIDITPFIYEAAEYDALHSYWGAAYPYAKDYALRYVSGDNAITGLNFKINKKVGNETKVGEIAIKKILETKGIDTSKLTTINLGFSVTYIPIVNSRVTAKKSLYKKERNDNYRIYNQHGNTVESEYYGTNMKGVLARIGNIVYRRTYEFNSYDDIPKCGQIVDGMYVAVVERSFDITHIKVTLTLTPNFNKLAEFMGVNSNYRLYDISEKQSVDRYINYGETCLISHKAYKCGNPLITNKGIATYAKMFSSLPFMLPSGVSISPVYAADMTTYAGREEYNTNLKEAARVGQTCASYALGNSMCFTVAMTDNYGAGYQASDAYENEEAKRANRLVPYSDALGNISYIDIALGSGLWRPTAESQTGKYGEANLYPELTYPGDNPYWIPVIETAGGNFFISKDSRERLIITLQLHNQTDEESIVLGEMLTLRNMLINGYHENESVAVYFLPHTINELDKTIDITGAWKPNLYLMSGYDGTSDYFKLEGFTNFGSNPTAKAWAIVDKATNRLYVGENVTVPPGGQTQPIYFNFMDNAALKAQEPA